MGRRAGAVAEQRHRRARHIRDRVAARGVEPVDDHRPVAAEDDVARDAGRRGRDARCSPAAAGASSARASDGVDGRRRPADLAHEPVALARERHRRHEHEQRVMDVGEQAAERRAAIGPIDYELPHRRAIDALPDARRRDRRSARCPGAAAPERRRREPLRRTAPRTWIQPSGVDGTGTLTTAPRPYACTVERVPRATMSPSCLAT